MHSKITLSRHAEKRMHNRKIGEDHGAYKNMEPSLSRREMTAWYRIIRCVWSFTSEEEVHSSVHDSLAILLRDINSEFNFSNEEWRRILRAKPGLCRLNDDLPLLDPCTLLLSRKDFASMELLQQFWPNDEQMETFDPYVMKYMATYRVNVKVKDGKRRAFERNAVNEMITTCSRHDLDVLERTKSLTKQGFCSDLADVNRWNATLWACDHGNIELLQWLVVGGSASLQFADRRGRKPLHLLTMGDKSNVLEMVEFVVEWQKLCRYVDKLLLSPDEKGENDLESSLDIIRRSRQVTSWDSIVSEYFVEDKEKRGYGYEVSAAGQQAVRRAWEDLRSLAYENDPSLDVYSPNYCHLSWGQ